MGKINLLLKLILEKRYLTVLDLVKNKVYSLIYFRKYYCNIFFRKHILGILRKPDQKFILIIDNNIGIGGGSKKYMDQFIHNNRHQDEILVRVYYDTRDKLYYLETIINKNKKYCLNINSLDFLHQSFNFSMISKIFVNQIISFPKPYEVFTFINNMKSMYQTKIELAVHDYYILCPSHNLINDKGVFCNIPEDLSRCNSCLNNPFHKASVFLGEKNIQIWRREWSSLIETTDRILLFSQSSKDLFLKTYPLVNKSKLKVVPHQLNKSLKVSYLGYKDKNYSNENIVIGVLGNITYIKGADIIKNMLEIIEATKLNIKIVIIGEYDSSYRHPSLKVTGRYMEKELFSLVKKNDIDIFFVSSICPETFSYTTEEILTMKYPVVCFNIGAPAERIRAYSDSYIIDVMDANAVLSATNLLYKGKK